MKKILALVLSFATLLCFAACNKNNDTNSTNNTNNKNNTTNTIESTKDTEPDIETTNPTTSDDKIPDNVKYNSEDFHVVLDHETYSEFNGKMKDVLGVSGALNTILINDALVECEYEMDNTHWSYVKVGDVDRVIYRVGKYLVTEKDGKLTAYRTGDEDIETHKQELKSLEIACTAEEFTSITELTYTSAALYNRNGVAYFQELDFYGNGASKPRRVYCAVGEEEFEVSHIRHNGYKFFVIIDDAQYETNSTLSIGNDKVVLDAIEKTKLDGVAEFIITERQEDFYVAKEDNTVLYCPPLIGDIDNTNWMSECGKLNMPEGYTTDDLEGIYNGIDAKIVFKMKDNSYFVIPSYDIPDAGETADLLRFEEADDATKKGTVLKVLHDTYNALYLMDDGYLYKFAD